MDEEKKYFNALNIALKTKYADLAKLKIDYGSYKAAFESTKNASLPDIDKEWEKLQKQNIGLLLLDESDFPTLLKEIPWPPLGIYFKGELPKNEEIKIAIVGTRKATSIGREIAESFSQKLAENNIVVVSGLAMGIDSASHAGALKVKGKTIAVLGNEIGSVYPRRNQKLAQQILKNNGCLISEYPLGFPTYRDNFLARNRIISGISKAVVIIEAPISSGSLNTARYALEQNREIFVVPGPINNKNYEGSFNLIREGARLVTSVKDILEDLNLEIKTEEQKHKSILQNINDQNQNIILKTLEEAGEPLTIDKISQIVKLEPQIVNQAISFLIIEEIVKETEKGYTIK